MLLLLLLLAGEPAQPDPQVQSPPPLTLAEAVHRARSRSPLGRAARDRAGSAANAATRVHRLPNPFLELRAENWGSGSAAENPRDTFAVVTQPIELGGKYGSRRREAAAFEALAQTGVSLAEWEVASEVVDRYISALKARGHVDVLGEQQRGLAEMVRILAERVKEGTTAEADWRRLEVEERRVRFAVSRAGIELQRELTLLAALVGGPVDAAQLVVPELPAAVTSVPLDASQVARRPDVRAARAEAEHFQAVTARERAAALPDLSVSAGYKGTGGFNTGVAAIGFDLPLFQRSGAAIARAAGDASAAAGTADYTTERALADATAQWTAAHRLAEEASSLETSLLAPAELVRTAARTTFLEGGGDILRLVDAERGYADAALDALTLRLDALHALLQARLSIGEDPLP